MKTQILSAILLGYLLVSPASAMPAANPRASSGPIEKTGVECDAWGNCWDRHWAREERRAWRRWNRDQERAWRHWRHHTEHAEEHDWFGW